MGPLYFITIRSWGAIEMIFSAVVLGLVTSFCIETYGTYIERSPVGRNNQRALRRMKLNPDNPTILHIHPPNQADKHLPLPGDEKLNEASH